MFMFNFYRSRVPIEHREQRLADRTVKPYQVGKMSKKKKLKKKRGDEGLLYCTLNLPNTFDAFQTKINENDT